MKEIAVYLLENYYAKYAGVQNIPSEDLLIRALNLHQDKMVVVHNNGVIEGVAIFLTLSDATYMDIDNQDITSVEMLSKLLQETGDNLHFILLTARGSKVIREGIKMVKGLHPKTVSWWNPTMTQLHKYSMN